MVGAGSALAGAAATRIIDLDRERRAEAASRRHDLDETRRLAYMVRAGRGIERYELAATLLNALTHHQSAVDPNTAMDHVITIMERDGDTRESQAWLLGHIQRISDELGPT
jgi:hypothetical protein